MPKPAQAKTVELTPDLIGKIAAWQIQASLLEQAKENESKLRLELAAIVGNPEKLEGTENFALANGYKLSVNKKQNYTLTNKNGETVALLQAINAVDPAIASSLVEWQPDMKKSSYNSLLKLIEVDMPLPPLPEHLPLYTIKTALAAALTIKPGMPTLEIVAPKEAGK